MPVWAAILVALASGGFGAALGVWNDRHERFRDRLINAADDLVAAGSDAMITVRDAIFQVERSSPAEEAIGAAWKKRDVVLLRGARVELLFGPSSDAARATTELTHKLGQTIDKAQGPKPDLAAARALHLEATAKLTELQRAAFEGIRSAAPPSATMRESLRRSLRR